MFQLGAGYQLTDDLYGTIAYEMYDVDLEDGNTAFQAYQLHEMASGSHQKDKIIVTAKYILAGSEIGFNYEYNTGSFDPDFGAGFVVQYAIGGRRAQRRRARGIARLPRPLRRLEQPGGAGLRPAAPEGVPEGAVLMARSGGTARGLRGQGAGRRMHCLAASRSPLC